MESGNNLASKQMNVFADLHHYSLYNSLRLLFEGRFGGKLYRPLGEDWLHQGFWKMAEIYNNHPLTVAQYLGIRPDYPNPIPGHYLAFDPENNYNQNAITLERFFKTPIDIVIATVPMHIQSFWALASAHPNHPKTIFQVGNQWEIDPAQPIKNIMASALLPTKPDGFNVVEYHQEFDTTIFKPNFDFTPENKITSFINCLNTASIYKHDWELFLEVERMMPQWVFKSLGGSCRDGEANGQKLMAEIMGQSKFVWHTKNGGDGFGHVIHNAYAMGVPPIVKTQYYTGKLAGQLMRDGETCIAIDGLGGEQIKTKIEHYSDPSQYERLRKNVYNEFVKHVNFDAEFETIKTFINNLI